jgi:hypothetical protein
MMLIMKYLPLMIMLATYSLSATFLGCGKKENDSKASNIQNSNVDSDGDGISDRQEVLNGAHPLISFESRIKRFQNFTTGSGSINGTLYRGPLYFTNQYERFLDYLSQYGEEADESHDWGLEVNEQNTVLNNQEKKNLQNINPSWNYLLTQSFGENFLKNFSVFPKVSLEQSKKSYRLVMLQKDDIAFYRISINWQPTNFLKQWSKTYNLFPEKSFYHQDDIVYAYELDRSLALNPVFTANQKIMIAENTPLKLQLFLTSPEKISILHQDKPNQLFENCNLLTGYNSERNKPFYIRTLWDEKDLKNITKMIYLNYRNTRRPLADYLTRPIEIFEIHEAGINLNVSLQLLRGIYEIELRPEEIETKLIDQVCVGESLYFPQRWQSYRRFSYSLLHHL